MGCSDCLTLPGTPSGLYLCSLCPCYCRLKIINTETLVPTWLCWLLRHLQSRSGWRTCWAHKVERPLPCVMDGSGTPFGTSFLEHHKEFQYRRSLQRATLLASCRASTLPAGRFGFDATISPQPFCMPGGHQGQGAVHWQSMRPGKYGFYKHFTAERRQKL